MAKIGCVKMKYKKNPSLALMTDWLCSSGGAEQVILAWHKEWSESPIYTTIYNPTKVPQFSEAKVISSFLDKYPKAKTHHQYFFGTMPRAVESLDFTDYDVVLSSSHSCAKGIVTKPETCHICYCHTPPRYLWEPEIDDRLAKQKWPISIYTKNLIHKTRLWDRLSADRVDFFIANSNYVAQRIQKFYRRDATVIYPPVNVKRFVPTPKPLNYLLMIGRLIPYKRFDLAIQACNSLGVPLKIVGDGPEMENLKKMAGPTIEFLGRVPDAQIPDLYSHCNAFLFPQLEDFGITAVEAQASGRPVIAYRAGGALETIKEGITGTFFDEQTVDSLAKTIRNFDTFKVKPQYIRQYAMKFSTNNHIEQIKNFTEKKYTEYQMGHFDPSLGNL